MYMRRRKFTRLDKGCYRLPITCFITFCVIKKQCFFGEIKDASVILSEFGQRIKEIWLDIGIMHPNIDVSNYIVMPNHFHGIINISENKAHESEIQSANEELNVLYNIIRDYKSFSTHEYNKLKDTKSLQLWQRGYYDHIIRDQNEYDLIKRYIENNPSQWSRDKFYL
jgi:putative transposase